MTILAALEEIFDDLPAIKTFIYADLNEANGTYLDKMVNAEYPVMLVLPFAVIDTPAQSGILKSTFELYAFMLDKQDAATADYSSIEIETDIIAPMRLLARRFVHKLNEHSIIDPTSAGIQSMNFQPTYGEFDSHLFGVLFRGTIPVMENEIICQP